MLKNRHLKFAGLNFHFELRDRVISSPAGAAALNVQLAAVPLQTDMFWPPNPQFMHAKVGGDHSKTIPNPQESAQRLMLQTAVLIRYATSFSFLDFLGFSGKVS